MDQARKKIFAVLLCFKAAKKAVMSTRLKNIKVLNMAAKIPIL
jgi:hypothetical protein